MKNRYLYSLLFALSLIIIFLLVNDNEFFYRSICKEKRKKFILEFSARVIEKYNDSLNHNYNTLILKDTITSQRKKIYIINDTGDFYESVKEGDYLVKNTNTLIIRNLSQNRIDTLKYLCPDD